MDFTPSEEQRLLRETVRRFLADRTDAATMGRGPIASPDWRALAELGVLGVVMPDSAGGLAGGPQDAMIVAEEFGRALAITPFAESILGAADLIARYGSADQIERWVAPAIDGNLSLALAEGDVTFRDEALHGACDFVRWGNAADGFVVVADGSAWVVAGDAPGLSRMPARLADGSIAAMLRLDGCKGDRLNFTPAHMAATRALVQLGYCAELAGLMATLYDQTVDHVRERRQFGTPIGSFQAVQHKVARMFVMLEQTRSLVLKAGIRSLDDPDFPRAVLTAKAYAADTAQRLAEEAVQLHGGMGVTDELPVGRGLRRVMVLARLFGSAADARKALAA